MNPFVIHVRMKKITLQFNATSFKFPALPVAQANQVIPTKATAKGRKGTHQIPKVEAKDVVGSKADEAKLPKATKPIPLRVEKEKTKAKARPQTTQHKETQYNPSTLKTKTRQQNNTNTLNAQP